MEGEEGQFQVLDNACTEPLVHAIGKSEIDLVFWVYKNIYGEFKSWRIKWGQGFSKHCVCIKELAFACWFLRSAEVDPQTSGVSELTSSLSSLGPSTWYKGLVVNRELK